MRLHAIVFALLPIFALIAKTNASANATVNPVHLKTYPFSRNRSNTLVSEPQSANYEERLDGIKPFGKENKFATLLAKSVRALWKHDVNSQLELKVAWWRVKNKDPDKVYAKLKLNEVEQDILSNSWFHVWVKYVESFNLEHPKKQVSIFEKLWNKYGDYKLAMMLEQAQRNADTSLQAFGTKLQIELMSFWRDHNMDARKLFRILHLDRHEPSLLTDPALNIWKIYASDFNPGMPVALLDQLYYTFGDVRLSLLLIAAKRLGNTATLASHLQHQLLAVWLNNRVKPEVVFRFLRLNKDPNHLLDKPEIEIWMKYAEKYREEAEMDVTLKNREETEADVTLREIIKEYFSADEIEAIISSAKTEYGKNLAKELKTPEA